MMLVACIVVTLVILDLIVRPLFLLAIGRRDLLAHNRDGRR